MKQLCIVAALLCSIASNAQDKSKLEKLASTISPGDLKAKLSIIAGAGMEGRETATPAQKRAAAYIEEQFKQFGLKPANAGSYQMVFPVYQDVVRSSSFTVNGKSLEAFEDYALSPLAMNTGTWGGDSIVFASFGIVDSLKNDFKAADVKNKWVLIAEGSAEDADKPTMVYSSRSPSSTFFKIMQTRAYGAKGIISITKNFPRTATDLKGNMYLKANTGNVLPVIYVSYNTAAAMLSQSLKSFADVKNISMGSYPVSFSFSSVKTTDTLQSSNVLGIMEGTDKKDEYVFITAHYDHLGKRDSVIYYGADDDGSGTTSVLELAEAFSKAKKKGFSPRRSIVFMTVSGEEKGLWGSEYYAAHPAFPLEKTDVDLNIDMVGRIDPDRKYGDSMNYVYTIGEDKLSSDLLPISDSVNNEFSKLELDRKYNDPKDPNRFYYRSDHYNFAKNGVPVIFYFNGTHADYHQPTDTVDKINFDLMTKRVKLVFYTAWAMANRDAMLKRDIPLK